MVPKKTGSLLLATLCVLLYGYLAFFVERTNTVQLLTSFVVLFGIYLWIAKKIPENELTFWIIAAFVFRASFLFSIPHLSDDFYRFLWDGHLLNAGYHPFAHVPRYYIDQSIAIPGISIQLFNLLNSPDYFTIYPPVNQFVFSVSAKLGGDTIWIGVVVMRLFILLAEVGSIWFIYKILKHHQLPPSRVLLYALNPLIVVEFTGNLHFEALMIFFLLASYWFFLRNQLIPSALFFSLAICTKLLPVIFLPLFIVRLGWKRVSVFYLFVFLFTLIFFMPLLNWEIINGFRESLGYYFKKFEFNASIYYLVREWGFWKYGYNIIQTVGWKLAVYASAAIVLFYAWDAWTVWKKQDSNTLWLGYLALLTIYFLFSTVVHPWYVGTLVAFSLFTTSRFAIVWSAVIVLTYAGYSHAGYHESLLLVTAEYVIVGIFAFVEWRTHFKFSQAQIPS
jgi:alpha-1,6-mannosyltransferase